MKKGLVFLLSIMSFFIFSCYVRAENFYEGEYLNEYVKKKNNGVTYYMTMQFIRDEKGNIVYCLEPFTKFVEGKAYTDFEGDLTSYSSLTSEQKRRISLIIYYGYGYGNRTDNKWYAITQFMIWRELIPEEDVYFTGSLNGRKVTRYVDEMNEIYSDINNHEQVPSYQGEYEIDLGKDFIIQDFALDNVVLSSDFEYILENGLLIKNVKKDGRLSFTKNSNYYSGKVVIFDSVDSQDLIRPGNVDNPVYNIDLRVKKGNIKLDIKDDDSVYTVESDFTNTCYEILNSEEEKVDSVCTGVKGMTYNSIDLEYGEYTIKQISHGTGYLGDEKTYKVTINKDSINPSVTLYNYLLKNKIEIKKYACKDNQCAFEENAAFEIIDKNNKIVDLITTNKLGEAEITLGYGNYKVKQNKGIEGYTLSSDYSERILDEESSHRKELFNNYIQEDVVVKKEIPELPVEELKVELPQVENVLEEIPNTRTDLNVSWLFLIVGLIIKKILCNL